MIDVTSISSELATGCQVLLHSTTMYCPTLSPVLLATLIVESEAPHAVESVVDETGTVPLMPHS